MRGKSRGHENEFTENARRRSRNISDCARINSGGLRTMAGEFAGYNVEVAITPANQGLKSEDPAHRADRCRVQSKVRLPKGQRASFALGARPSCVVFPVSSFLFGAFGT